MRYLFRGLLFTALLVLLVGAWVAWSPNTTSDGAPHSVKIPEGTDFETAIDSLERAGALRSAATFRVFGRATGWASQIKPGHYLIEGGMSNWAVLDKIRKGREDPIRITILPGLTTKRFAQALQEQLGTDPDSVLAALSDTTLAGTLGTDTTHLFGHMRANTYDIFWTTNADEAITRIHAWYERFWTDERRAKAEELGLTPDEVVTLASIVEWEVRKPEESARVAGVYLNRLLGRTAAGTMRLQADPTVQYALMKQDGGSRRRLFVRDYRTPSPYNTYLVDGLPPGPITNPSDASIDAVLDNEEHDYLFFVADTTGGHDFSRTGAEHMEKVRRWREWLSEQVRIRDSLAQDSIQ